jgi:uncharacterized protein YdeI (YjbR/CyaY-like superfamily)
VFNNPRSGYKWLSFADKLMTMDSSETLYVTNRKEWRQWLEKHFDIETEIWLVYPRKKTNKPRIGYNDAVEEALCYGWIDSTVKSMDEMHTCQRFTPRNPGSSYSRANIERLKWLSEQGMIHPLIENSVRNILNQEFVFPSDIIDTIKEDKLAWKNYRNFSDSYKRIRIAYIDSSRRRPEEFNKRLKNFINKTRDNMLIRGFGGIDKYY